METKKAKKVADEIQHKLDMEKTKWDVNEQLHKEHEKTIAAQTKKIEEQKLEAEKKAAEEIKKINATEVSTEKKYEDEVKKEKSMAQQLTVMQGEEKKVAEKIEVEQKIAQEKAAR